MQINISGHHVEVTDALKEYVSGKLEKLENHSADIVSIKAISQRGEKKPKSRSHHPRQRRRYFCQCRT